MPDNWDDDFAAVGAGNTAVRARSNVAAVGAVSPDNAAQAVAHGPGNGVPAALAMHDPTPVIEQAHIRGQQAILNDSPHVQQWAAGDPAKVAATQDDFPSLAKIGDFLSRTNDELNRFGQQRYVTTGLLKNLTDPIAETFHALPRDLGRLLTPNSQDQYQQLKAGLSTVGNVLGLFPGVAAFGSVLNETYVQPGAKLLDLGAHPGLTPEQFHSANEARLGLGLFALRPGMASAEAAAAHPAGPQDFSHPLSPDDSGSFATSPEGHVMGETAPATFRTQKDAAQWILKHGNKSPSQLWDIGANDDGSYHVFQRNEVEPFKQLPAPGVEPAADAAYAVHAEQSEEFLGKLQDMVAESKTHDRAPELMQEYVEQVAPNQVVKLDPDKLWEIATEAQHEMPQLDNEWNKVLDAINSGQKYEMSLAEYIAMTAGKPWAAELNKHVAIGDGVSKEEAKDLPTAPALAKFLEAAKAYAGAPWSYEQAAEEIKWLKTSVPETSWLSETKAFVDSFDALAKTSAEPTGDEDTLASMADQGMSPHDYFTGKEFPEPEDLDTSDFDPAEQQQYTQAKQSVKAAIKRVAKEKFLAQLFKDQKAVSLTEPQFKAYSNRVEKAFKDLSEKLWRQTHAKIKAQYTAEWKEVYNQIFPQVLNEVMSDPVVMAEHALRYSKVVEDELRKNNALVDAKGQPLTYYHGSQHWDIGTEQNPSFEKKGYNVISFSTDPKFANDWMSGDSFSPWEAYDFDSDYAAGQAKTIYVVNIKAKNPADFRKQEDVLKAASWHAEHDFQMQDYDNGSVSMKHQILLQNGLKQEVSEGTRAALILKLRQRFISPLSQGSYSMWEKPKMWKDLGWDAAHMKESASSPYVNICVEDGNQVYFRYRFTTEVPGTKLSPSIKENYPQDLWEKLPNNMFSKESGRSADEVASMTGFDSGEAMLQSLRDFERERGETPFRKFIKQKAETEARQQTIAKVGDLLDPDRILEDAKEIFVSPEVEDILTDEFKTLAKEVGAPIDAAAVKNFTLEQFNTRPISEAVKIKDLERAVKKWGDKAEQFMAKGKPDFLEAFKAKQRQLINFIQLKRAHEVKDLWTKGDKRFKSLAKSKSRSGMAQEYLDTIHGELEKYGYKVPQSNLAYSYEKWWNEQLALGNTPSIDRPLPPKQDSKDLTVDDFEALVDRVANMSKLGHDAKHIEVAGKKVETAALAAEAAAVAVKVPNQMLANEAGYEPSAIVKVKHLFSRIEYWADKLDDGDPNGVWNRALIWGARDAQQRITAFRKEFLNSIDEAWKAIPSKERNKLSSRVAKGHGLLNPETKQDLDLSRSDVIGFALHKGSEINSWHLGEGGWGFDPQHVDAFLARNMTPSLAKFIQHIFDLLEEQWPKIAENELARSGLAPEKVKATPFVVGAHEFSGGYFPLGRDPRFSDRLPELTIDSLMNTFMGDATTSKGYTKKRSWTAYAQQLNWRFMLFDHMDKVGKRLAYSGYLENANRFLRDKTIRNILRDKMGVGALDEVQDWLKRQVAFRMVDPYAVQVADDFARFLRGHMYAGQAAANFVILAEHSSAYAQSVAQIGKGATLRGLMAFANKLGPIGSNEFIHGRSEFMANRMLAVNRELRDWGEELRRDVKLLPKEIPLVDPVIKTVQTLGHQLLSAVNHYFIAQPTWLGAYFSAMDGTAKSVFGDVLPQMEESEAVRYADKAVAESHGTGSVMDLNRMQATNNEFLKLINAYYSYHGNQLNLIARATDQAGGGNTAARKLRGYHNGFILIVLAALVGKLVTDHAPKKGEEVPWAADTIAGALTNTVPVLRETYGEFSSWLKYKKFDFEISPLTREMENLGEATRNTYLAAAHELSIDKKNKLSHNALMKELEAIGFAIGVPGVQPGRTAQVIQDMQHPGKVKRPVPALLYGPSHEKKAPG